MWPWDKFFCSLIAFNRSPMFKKPSREFLVVTIFAPHYTLRFLCSPDAVPDVAPNGLPLIENRVQKQQAITN